MSKLSGQVALVTGASRGIGRGIALELGRAGATVIGTSTSAEGARDISSTLEGHGYSGWGLQLDVTDSAAMDRLVSDIETKVGVISILINNAGITRDNLAVRMKDDEWNDVISTNLNAVFRMCKLVMRGMMKARYGRIINITSLVASSGNVGQANYCAAKAGVEGLSRSLAQELGSRNVTVNCVAPGLIDTDMTKKLSDSQRNAMLARVPLNRLGTIEDVASTVLFLSSPEAGYITGATLNVNGGMYMA